MEPRGISSTYPTGPPSDTPHIPPPGGHMSRTNLKTHVLAAAIFSALAALDASAATATQDEPAPEATEADAAPAPADGAATTLEAVMVTAQKREQAAIDVPASVTAIDTARLAKAGATQLE